MRTKLVRPRSSPRDHSRHNCPNRRSWRDEHMDVYEPYRVAVAKSDAETEDLAAAYLARNPGITPSPLTLAMFPHIEMAILHAVDIPTLKKLMLTSTHMWKLAAPILRARHLTVVLLPQDKCSCQLPPMHKGAARATRADPDPDEDFDPDYPSPGQIVWHTEEEYNLWVIENNYVPAQAVFLHGYPRSFEFSTRYTWLTAPPGGFKNIPRARNPRARYIVDSASMTQILDIKYHSLTTHKPPRWSWSWYDVGLCFRNGDWSNVRLIRDMPGTFPTTDAEFAALHPWLPDPEWKSPFINLKVVSQVQILGTNFATGKCPPTPLNAFHNIVVSLWIHFGDDKKTVPGRFFRYEPEDIPTKHVTVMLPTWDATRADHTIQDKSPVDPFATKKDAQRHMNDVVLEIYLCWMSKAASVTVVGYERVKRRSPAAHAEAIKALRRAVACSNAGHQTWWITPAQRNTSLVEHFTGELSSHNPNNANMNLPPSNRPTRRCNLKFETLESYIERVGEYDALLHDLHRFRATK